MTDPDLVEAFRQARHESEALTNALARELAGELEMPLQMTELRLERPRTGTREQSDALAELEGLFVQANDHEFRGLTLAALMDRPHEQSKIVRTGLVFLQRKRCAEAAEWWSLQRSSASGHSDRFDLMLLLLQALAWELAGVSERARTLRLQAREHPAFAAYAGKHRAS